MAYKNPIDQSESLTPKVRYFKHPDVDGVWHDTGKLENRYGTDYHVYENEEGHPWAVSDRFAQQFQEVDEPRHPFKLDREKYPDVEETPYGYIYNVNGRSITDHNAMRKFFYDRGADPFDDYDELRDYGWTLNTPDNDESFYSSFEEAYKAAKGIK